MRTKGVFILSIGFVLIMQIANPLWAQQDKLKIGLLAPITGTNPDWGKKQVIGLEVALEKVNRRGGVGGIPIEAVIADTGSDPQQAVTAYRKMAGADKVLVIIGPLFTSECVDLFPVTNAEKTAVIATASANPGLSDLNKWPYAFRMTVTSDKKEGPLVKSWVEANKIKTVVILYDRDSAITTVIAETIWPNLLKELNVPILNAHDPISFPEGQTDFRKPVKRP